MLAGTDSFNAYCFPGFAVHDELELFVEAGMSPLEALQTATLNPARYLNLSQSFGTVEQGKIADLVLLHANPLETIGNTQKIAGVVVNGKYLPGEQLRTMLADVEAIANKN
jgi:imidazolonepropionase-like amidohydrolase